MWEAGILTLSEIVSSSVPCFASSSAVSLPGWPLCAGIHTRVTIAVCFARAFRASIVSRTVRLVIRGLAIAERAACESANIFTNLRFGGGLGKQCRCCLADCGYLCLENGSVVAESLIFGYDFSLPFIYRKSEARPVVHSATIGVDVVLGRGPVLGVPAETGPVQAESCAPPDVGAGVRARGVNLQFVEHLGPFCQVAGAVRFIFVCAPPVQRDRGVNSEVRCDRLLCTGEV